MSSVILNPVLTMLHEAQLVRVNVKKDYIYVLKADRMLFVADSSGSTIDMVRLGGDLKANRGRLIMLAKKGLLPNSGVFERGRVIPNKPIYAIDFDSVIYAGNSEDWTCVIKLPGSPSVKAKELLDRVSDAGFKIAIVSFRLGRPGGLKAIQHWMQKHQLEKKHMVYSITSPPACVFLSGRAKEYKGELPLKASLDALKASFDADRFKSVVEGAKE